MTVWGPTFVEAARLSEDEVALRHQPVEDAVQEVVRLEVAEAREDPSTHDHLEGTRGKAQPE